MRSTKLLFAVFGCAFLLWASADARPAMLSQIAPAIRGTNLGGWLVIERFINPSFFSLANDPKVRCEWTWCEKYQNDNETLQILRNHWANWVTEADMQKIASIGITHLRIPIGYWAYLSQEELIERNEPFLTGQLPYLNRALGWAKKYGLKAIMDLHGAPGSQNGFDNSGHADVLEWGTGDTINRTLDVIERMSKHILSLEANNETSGVVVGLELLNEAATFKTSLVGGINTVKDYYIRGYHVARKHLPADKYIIVVEGAFMAYEWSGFMPAPEFQNVQLDLHIYHCFDAGMRAAPYNAHLSITCNIDINQLKNQTLPTFIGEWSTAWKVESDYASGEPFPDEEQQGFMKKFIAAQMYAYDSWYWWNFKCEDAVMWDLFTGYDNGWFPTVPSTQVAGACDDYLTA